MAQASASALYRTPDRPVPAGVAALSILIGLAGIGLLIAAVLIMVSPPPIVRPFAAFGVSPFGGMVLLVFAILLLVVASGLWYLERWAFVLAIVVLGLLWIEVALTGAFVSLASLVLAILLVALFASVRSFG
jgi:hypothetical protein